MRFADMPKTRFADVPVGARCVLESTLLVKIEPVADPAAAAFYARYGDTSWSGWNAAHGPLHGSGGSCGPGFMSLDADDLVGVFRGDESPYLDQWFAEAQKQADATTRPFRV